MRHFYNSKYKNVTLLPLSGEDIELLRAWRNNPENCVYLRNIPYITEKMQLTWYEVYLQNDRELMFSIIENEKLQRCVGSLSLYDIKDKTCFFGKILIGDMLAHGRSIGLNATIAALKVAFYQLKMEQVYLHVYADNMAAIRVYEKANFHIVETRVDDNNQREYTMITCKEEMEECEYA